MAIIQVPLEMGDGEFEGSLVRAEEHVYYVGSEGKAFEENLGLYLEDALSSVPPEVGGVYIGAGNKMVSLREGLLQDGHRGSAVLLQGSFVSEISYAFFEFPLNTRAVARMYCLLLGDFRQVISFSEDYSKGIKRDNSAVLREVSSIVTLCAKCQGRLNPVRAVKVLKDVEVVKPIRREIMPTGRLVTSCCGRP